MSEVALGVNVRSAGALPGGRVLALNSGAASLPVSTPGLCCEEKLMSDMYFSRKGERVGISG